MRRFGQSRAIPLQIGILGNIDARDRRTQPQPRLRVELEFAHLLDALHIDDKIGLSDTGAHLDQEVGTSADRPRLFAVRLHDFERIGQRGRSFVIKCVQVGTSSR